MLRNERNYLNRRAFVKLAGIATVGSALVDICEGGEKSPVVIPLFDGKSLNGWIQIQNSATSFSSGEIINQAALIDKLAKGADAVSIYLRSRLEDTVRADLISYSQPKTNTKKVISELVNNLNQIISGQSIYDKARFGGIALRPETRDLLREHVHSQSLAQLNKLLLEDAYPTDILPSPSTGWMVKNGTMASTGAGRGVIYTAEDYSHYRLMFSMRHVSGNPDHQACVLIFCTRPGKEEKPLDALGGIQFQVPNGGHWDYRPGMNNSGGPEFTTITKAGFDIHEWSRVEILVDAAKGTARMAVAQPPESRAIEVLDFKDASAGKAGPIAWQMHNAGLFDEYKDITVELDPKEDSLITSR